MSSDNINESNVRDNSTQSDSISNTDVVDPEFVRVFKFIAPPPIPKEPPDWLHKNIMESYRKDNYYKIIWWNVKTKLGEWNNFSPLNMQLGMKVALASVILLFAVTVVYFQYQIFNNVKQNNPIVNKQTPTFSIKPSPTPNPESTPSLEENKSFITEEKQKTDKTKSTRGLEEEKKDRIAYNFTKPDKNVKSNTRTFKIEDLNTIKAIVKLESIKKVYLRDLMKVQENREWVLEFSNELKKGVEKYWEIEESEQEAATADVVFKLENNTLVLKNKKHNTLWVSKFKLDPMIDDPKNLASKIADELREKIKSKSKSDVTNNTKSSSKEDTEK
jgi:hypothetical protein